MLFGNRGQSLLTLTERRSRSLLTLTERRFRVLRCRYCQRTGTVTGYGGRRVSLVPQTDDDDGYSYSRTATFGLLQNRIQTNVGGPIFFGATNNLATGAPTVSRAAPVGQTLTG